MIVGRRIFALFSPVGVIVVDRGPPSHAAETPLRDAPRPSQHFYPPAQRLSQTSFSRRRRIRSSGSFQVGVRRSTRRNLPLDGVAPVIRLVDYLYLRLRFRSRIRAEVILLEGM